ncbi:MAG: hypothetical protein NC203_08595 [Firmicutes bacterium]|nr:hypothetical protein [[Eubacterium] siraeum]MCM1488410.1 hypothetical protein [Bacillota bacterium]
MKYALYIVTALYAVLSFIAAFSQLKKADQKTPYAVMAFGGLILMAEIGLHIIGVPFNWIAAVVGGVLICASAIYNGKKSGSFHITHHIIRFAVTLLIIAGFIFI